MSKKNATSTTIGAVTVNINQKLHGIEVSGTITTQQDKRLREMGFWFSKRKGHYWTAFDADLYAQTLEYFEGYAKSKAKNKGAAPKTMAQAAPIDMKEAFSSEKAKTKGKGKKAKAEASAELADDFGFGTEPEEKQVTMDEVKAEPKKTKSKAKKAEPSPAPAPAKAEPKEAEETSDLKLWKSQVLMAVEKILDDSIAALAKGEAA